ncbi:MAG: hypothetical protein ABLQ96_04085 [Candidatus Acidiferrum sp.]
MNPNQALWEKGDFTRIAESMRESGEALVTCAARLSSLLLIQLAVTLMNILKNVLATLLFALFVTFSSTPAWGETLPSLRSSLTVSVYNDAGVPFATLQDAEVISSRIFEEAGIHIEWINCLPGNSSTGAVCKLAVTVGQLQVRVCRHSLNLSSSVLGISYLSDVGGSQADVFYESIKELPQNMTGQPAIILGHVMSHEIGHLLLGTNSHSPLGIMRAQWAKQQIGLAAIGRMYFDESQSRRMTERLRKTSSRVQCSPGTEYSATN